MCSLQAVGAAAPHEGQQGFPWQEERPGPQLPLAKRLEQRGGGRGLGAAASPLAQLEVPQGSITPPSLPGTAWEHLPQEKGGDAPRGCRSLRLPLCAAPMASLASVQ